MRRSEEIDREDERELLAAQLSAYASQVWLMAVGNLGIALLLAVFLWGVVGQGVLLGWLAAIVAVNGMRILLIPDMARRPDTPTLKRGLRTAAFLTALTGMLWGSAAWLLFPDSLTHQIILMLTLSGFAAGAMTLVGSVPLAYPAFVVLLLTPLALVLHGSGIETYRNVSLLLVVYGLYLVMSYQTHRRLFLESVRLRIQLQRLAHLDPLTRIPNRRHFDERFPAECRRASREDSPLSLILLDIDHFKRLNDTLGHQAGDHVLRDVAARLGESIRRPGDFVARIGGEEFAVVLPGTDAEGAEVVADAIRRSMDRVRLPSDTMPGGRLTTSMGIACCRRRPCDAGRLFAEADAALYRAKQEGRDTWRVAGGCREDAEGA